MQILSRPTNNCPTFGIRVGGLSLAVAMIGGCSAFSPSTAALPAGAVQLAARPDFAAWFSKTEACARVSGQFQQIQWFVVPGAATFETSEGPKVGMWEKSGSVARIIIAGRYLDHEMVVRHEMLHHLLDREGHPQEFFADRCHLTWETWPNAAADH